MTDHPAKAIYAAMNEDAKRGPLAKPLLVARAIAIAAAVAGAIPTGMNLYQSWKHGIPFTQVSERLAQYDLWVKNFECKIEYKAISTAQGTRVDVGACPKSGDIAVRVTANGKAAYEWIPATRLQNASMAAASGLMSLIISPAVAEELPPKQAAPVQVAQANLQVVCQSMQPKMMIVRIVNEGGKCFRETFSPVVGKVEKREEVPCNTACPAPAKG